MMGELKKAGPFWRDLHTVHTVLFFVAFGMETGSASMLNLPVDLCWATSPFGVSWFFRSLTRGCNPEFHNHCFYAMLESQDQSQAWHDG